MIVGSRLRSFVIILIGLVTLTFFAVRLLPGDPALFMLGDYATERSLADLRNRLGLDRPLYEQYAMYWKQIAFGDLGSSLVTRRPVVRDILGVLPPTIELATLGTIIAALIGIPLGALSAIKRRSWIDYLAMSVALLGVSMPLFWLGMLLLLVFSLFLGWFPSTGPPRDAGFAVRIYYAFLPSLTLGIYMAGLLSRVTKSAVLEVVREDFIRTARSKGLHEYAITVRHILRSSLVPIVTTIGLYFAIQLGGTVLVETVFARPGLGSLLVSAVFNRDYPVIQGVILFFALLLLIINLVTDLIISFLDPRIRY
ncbi:MAG: ABC transporter permease [Trueperaceae bacterium]